MAESPFNRVTLHPEQVLAGDSTQFTVRLIIGPGYTPGPSRLIFDLPATVGTSRPSQMHQEDHGYITARVSNPNVRYQLRIWDMEIKDFATREKGSWRGMAARMPVLDLEAGLQEGDVIEFYWGDTGGGYGAGTKVTTVVPRRDYAAQIHVRYFPKASEDANPGLPDYGPRSIPDYERPTPETEIELTFQVLPRAPHNLRLLRQQERALLIPQDVFWNVAKVAESATLVDGPPAARQNAFGVFEYDNPHVEVQSRGLPLTSAPAMDNVYDGYNLYWGDVHSHSAFSVDCVEREKMDMYPGDLMALARQRAGLDFYATTDHHEPHHASRNHIGRTAWEQTVEAVAQHHRPGEFVVFPGIEYRCPRGDTIVLFNWLPGYDEINQPAWEDVRALWQALLERDVLTIPHFHNTGQLAAGEWWQPPQAGTEPVLEIFSCHGSYEREDALEHHIPLIKRSRPDRYGVHFLKEGYRYGFVCNSDGHKGHVGSNGLTAVFARELTREALLEAYRKRHVYGTTNARIRLLFTGNGALMGDVVPNTEVKQLRLDVVGENTLKKIELFRDGELYHRFTPQGVTFKTRVEVADPAPSNWYVRVTQQDHHIAYSSPIWYVQEHDKA